MQARISVDVKAYISKAIDARILSAKAALKSGNHGFRGEALSFTATEIERDVREAMRADLEAATGRIVGRTRLSAGQYLLGDVRDELYRRRRNGDLESHNYGRGHCSGERFRPAGAPLSKSEQESLETPREEKRRRAHIVHFAREDGKAACGADDRKRGWYSGRSRQWKPKPATDSKDVTCKKCLSMLAHGKEEKEAGAC